MPRVAKSLSPIQIKGITSPGYHAVGGVAGLYLQVSNAGTKSWVLRVKVGDKRREIGLGAYDPSGNGLALAREKAQKVRDEILAGIDPVLQRSLNRQSIVQAQIEDKAMRWTFRACAEAYIKAKSPGWKNLKHASQWTNTLETYAYPTIGDLLVRKINIGHITAIIEPHWTSKNETINRVRNRIELVLDWATVRKYRTGDNPARWKGNLDKAGLAERSVVGKVRHHPAVQYREAYEFLNALKNTVGIGARCTEFVLLTGARSVEALQATWQELDLTGKIWNIPGERMKSTRPHRVPLSDDVICLLNSLPKIEGNNFVFPGRKSDGPLSGMTMNKIMKGLGFKDRDGRIAVPHGLRSTFSSWVASSTSYPFEVREMALAHAIGDETVASYQRDDLFEKRRNLMEDWAKFTRTAPVVGTNVLPMHKAA